MQIWRPAAAILKGTRHCIAYYVEAVHSLGGSNDIGGCLCYLALLLESE